MDVELHPAPEPATAKAWLEAPMPGAACCALQPSALSDCLRAQRFTLTDALYRRLADPASPRTCLAEDGRGGIWRIRRCGEVNTATLWLLQALSESRFALAALMRGAMARRLAGHVLHELRNPLNAVSLYADVLALLLPKAADAGAQEKAGAALKSIKERLQELNLRQLSSVVVWSGDAELEAAVPVAAIWRDVSRLITAYLTLKAIALRASGVEHLEQCALTASRPLLALVWIGVLLMAADGAATCAEGTPERTVRLTAAPAATAAGTIHIEVAAPLAADAFGPELRLADAKAAAAALSLLLHGAAVALEHKADGGMVLSLWPSPS